MDDIKPKNIEEKVDAVLRILTGEPMDQKDEGLIGEVRKIKSELYKLINWKNKTVSWAIGVSFGGGALITFVLKTLFK